MNHRNDLTSRIRALQDELEEEFERRRDAFRYRMENGRVVFEEEMRSKHRAMRVRLTTFLRNTRPLVVLTSPVIYSLVIPLALLDLFVVLYQIICFPVYGIPRVRRADYIHIDRHHLAYLNGLQKLNCVYCGYGNGVIAFVREVAGRTEAYWCPIKHAARLPDPHPHYIGFSEYGDAEGYDAGVAENRKNVAGKT